MTSEEYILLYEKYLSGYCTAEEIKLLAAHRDKFKMLETDRELSPEERKIKAEIYQRIHQTLFVKQPKVINLRFWWVAATLLIGISVGVIFLKQAPKKLVANNVKVKPAIIKPGRNTAVLTLADGSNIQLDEAKSGLLATVGKTAIKKLVSGEIVYDASGNTNAVASMNTISIPRGGQYPLTLSDGTKVWLNSVSSLTYPTSFTGNERVVELKGEAYFEVAHNAKMPFKVKTNNVNVEVLGTHFNIKAYADEAAVKTTLLEGSVQLSNKNASVKLVPGEQGITNNNNADINVKNVKVAEVIAWKNGSFVFREANIQEIMKQISRWYDVDVEYRGNLSDQYFGGTYSKYKDISELLKGLELTGLIHFKIEGRRIIAMP
jgi:transmembrane sensor